jgi:hypothetical protein
MAQTADDKPTPPTDRSVRPPLRHRLKTLVTQGHTPEKIALSIAFGIALGLFPIFGTTTLLCIVVAVVLRLNHPAIQVANQLMYVVQLPLIVVFIRIGESLLGVAPIPFSATLMAAELRANPSSLVQRFGVAGLHGILGWVVVAPVVVGVAYAVLLPLIRLASRRPSAPASQPATGA